ncbi:MFS transporter [Streptomyces sp. CA-253872]|uniref:MFS transporter n=1 Tax=Streptomyces sp. CA-253872 TaxID=3240067 RepID=UPI003D928D8F
MAVPAPAAPVAPLRPAHRDGNVLRWLLAYTASLVGDGVYFVALAWAAQRVAGPTEVGFVMATGAVPRAVLMLGGGVLADRFDPRRIVLGSDAVRCVLILGVAGAVALTSPALWLLVLVALVFGTVDALFVPAVGALPPRLTRPDQFARVVGMRSLAMRLSQITAPPLAGLALGLGGVPVTFAVAGTLFALSLPLLSSLRIHPPEATNEAETPAAPTRLRAELADGLRYIGGHPLVRPLVLALALCELGLSSTLNVGLILLNAERGWGPSGYGWIVGAFGAGAAAGAALLTVVGWVPRAGLVLGGTLGLACVSTGVLGFVPVLGVVVGCAALTGLAAGTAGSLNNSLLQNAADPAYLGRVTSVVMLTMVGLAPLSYPVAGAAIGAWGAGPVFAATAALSACGAAYLLLGRAARGAELPRARAALKDRSASPDAAPREAGASGA